MVFVDIIIEDDSGEEEEEEDRNLPYELTKEAVVMDMKVKMLMVRAWVAIHERVSGLCSLCM